MPRKSEWEYPSLAWIHRVREAHYQKTKGVPVEQWLQPPDPQQLVRASRALGLPVRLPHAAKCKSA
jgi:hypothetical protein